MLTVHSAHFTFDSLYFRAQLSMYPISLDPRSCRSAVRPVCNDLHALSLSGQVLSQIEMRSSVATASLVARKGAQASRPKLSKWLENTGSLYS
jgi:hypothetical protein